MSNMLAENPTTIIRMKSGWVCMGFAQFLPGYCLLFADPEVPSLNDLDASTRADFLRDMGLLGDAIMKVCQPLRINYGVFGNSEPVLHAHLIPRYEWEPAERRTRNVWTYPEEFWTAPEHKFDDARHGELKMRLTKVLQELIQTVY